MIFWFVYSSIHYTLIIQSFPNALWFFICFTLSILYVVHCSRIWNCGTRAFWVTGINVLPHMLSTSVFLFSLFPSKTFSFFLLCQHRKYKYGETYTTHTLSTYASSNTHFLLPFRFAWFVTYIPLDPDPLLFSDFNSDEFTNMKCWMVG